MKQSSIEWYNSELNDIDFKLQSKLINFEQCKDLMKQALQQAKSMEQQFIVDAFMAGAEIGEMFNNENRKFYIDAKQYYKNTYENETKPN